MFHDRLDAGRQLAAKLSMYKGNSNAIVLGIPRGGVETAFAVAMELGLELGIVVSKKLPFPGNPELAIGAVSSDGIVSLDDSFVLKYGIGKDYISEEAKKLAAEVRRRYAAYGAIFPNVKEKIAIVVDDGIATGHTVLAAVRALKGKKPGKIIVAAPVSSKEAFELLKAEADDVVCLDVPEFFRAVGEFYRSFPQLTDEDVVRYIKLADKK